MGIGKPSEPESGSRIGVWVPMSSTKRTRFEAWYDPTKREYVLDAVFNEPLSRPESYVHPTA